jgi:hypothetical protein
LQIGWSGERFWRYYKDMEKRLFHHDIDGEVCQLYEMFLKRGQVSAAFGNVEFLVG